MTDWRDTIVQGDALEVLKEIGAGSIDCIITDPPYFLPAKHYQTRKDFKRNFADLGILEGFFKILFSEIDRVLKTNGFLYMFCDGQSYPLFYYHLYPYFRILRPLIWDKKTAFTGYYWRHQHEIILFGVREKSPKIPTGKGDILRHSAVKVDERLHPAEKPVKLLLEIIAETSKEGDFILDPFCGSGTTCIAAKMLGRHYLGIDISPEYCEIANKRFAEIQRELL